MTGLEVLSMLLGIVLISIYLGGLISNAIEYDLYGIKNKNSHLFFKIFLMWLSVHIALSLNFTRYEQILRVSKSDKVYYLEQYKSDDLRLDKETYDKLKAMGNGDKLYINQSFYVTTLDKDGKEQRYSINKDNYKYILDYKAKVIDVKYDLWGNKKVE